MNRVIFAHGRESGPWGRKICALAKVAERAGWGVASLDFTATRDPDARVVQLCADVTRQRGRLVLAGSSMGGYVVTVASERLAPDGLFLMAPAFGLPGYEVSAPQPCAPHLTIVHGWRDELVPFDNVLAFARRHAAALHLFEDDHPLTESLPAIELLFGAFLAQVAQRPTPAQLSPHF